MKKGNKKGAVKNAIAIFGIIALVSLMLLVQAATQQELENEKAQLESELIEQGYGWLVEGM